MAVSESTARKAVEAWDLDGRATDYSCGCRLWSSVSMMLTTGPRVVRHCERHRPAFAPRDLPSA